MSVLLFTLQSREIIALSPPHQTKVQLTSRAERCVYVCVFLPLELPHCKLFKIYSYNSDDACSFPHLAAARLLVLIKATALHQSESESILDLWPGERYDTVPSMHLKTLDNARAVQTRYFKRDNNSKRELTDYCQLILDINNAIVRVPSTFIMFFNRSRHCWLIVQSFLLVTSVLKLVLFTSRLCDTFFSI